MVLARLILRRSGLRINRYDFPQPVRWFSSNPCDSDIEKPSQSRKTAVPKKERVAAVESFLKKYMETKPGCFPKVTHVQHAVGGSWANVKEIVNNLKENMLGTTQSENGLKIDASTPVKHTAISSVTTTHYTPDNEIDLHGHHESSLKPDEVRQGEVEEGNIGFSTGMAEGGCSSGLVVDPTSSDVTHTHHSSDSSEHDKLNVTECLDHQKIETTSSLSPSSSIEMSRKSPTPGAFGLVGRLSNTFQFVDDAEVSEANNGMAKPEKALSEIFSVLGKVKNSEGESLLSTGISQQSNSFNKRPNFRVNTSVRHSYENEPREVVASGQVHNTFSYMSDTFPSSKNLLGSKNMNGWKNASESVTTTNRENSMHNSSQYLEDPTRQHDINRDGLKYFMNYITGFAGGSSTPTLEQKISSPKTDENCKRSQLASHLLSSMSFDKKERNVSQEGHAVCGKGNHDTSSKVLPTSLRTRPDKMDSLEFTKPTGHSQLTVRTDKEESHEIVDNVSIMEETGEHKAVVKFLVGSVNQSDIVKILENCGDILEVKITSSKQAFYKNADVHFKSRKGLLNALGKTDLMLNGECAIVEAAVAGEDISNGITIPSLIGDRKVPADVVKNPTRTVKITQLTSEISWSDVVETLESSGNNVTGFTFGPSDSVAYVEFEEEDDKEAMLEKQSIVVHRKRLFLYRIDVPRTTVVRVSVHHPLHFKQVATACRTLGQAMIFRRRNPMNMDAHFSVTEWPNMLKILNSLNTLKVEGQKLQARPAPIIPPHILSTLWRHPEERIHVKNCVEKLLKNLGEDVVQKGDLADLLNFY